MYRIGMSTKIKVSKDIVKYAKSIARLYNVKIRTDKTQYRCAADCVKEIIFVSPHRGSDREYISSFCHEMQHILNKRNGKYPAYHNRKSYKESLKATIYHGFQAELYTDKQAVQFCKQFFPWIKFNSSYRLKRSKEWYLDNYQFPIKVLYHTRYYAKDSKRK